MIKVGLVAAPGPGRMAMERVLGDDPRLFLTITLDGAPPGGLPDGPNVWLVERSCVPDGPASAPMLRFGYGTGSLKADVVLPEDLDRLPRALEKLCLQLRSLGDSSRRAAKAVLNRPASIYPVGVSGGIDRLVIALGASTGGPAMLQQVIGALPKDGPAVLVVQHIGTPHVPALVRQLGRSAAMRVQLATDRAEVKPGHVYVAPGDRHLRIRRNKTGYQLELFAGAPVSGHRPSIDVLMSSLASSAGPYGMGVVMSGMGEDGADGLMSLRLSGGTTFAQDEASSTVYSMPRAAYEGGAAQKQLPLHKIAPELIRACGKLLSRRNH